MKCASPEAGLGANDEAPAVLVEVSELELWARLVVVRGDIHDDELGSNYLVKHWLWLVTLQLFTLPAFTVAVFLAHLFARLLD